MLRAAVVSLYWPNYEKLARLVMPNWREYTDRHGYELYVYCGQYGTGAIGFQKMRWLHHVLFAQGIDLALVVDLDLVFTDLTRRFEDYTDGQYSYWVTEDTHGLNNGSFIIRADEGGRQILDHMLARADWMPNEQDTIKFDLHRSPWKDLICILPHPSLNSLMYRLYPEYKDPAAISGNWEPGHFILHLPGCSLEKRVEIVTSPEVRAAIVR